MRDFSFPARPMLNIPVHPLESGPHRDGSCLHIRRNRPKGLFDPSPAGATQEESESDFLSPRSTGRGYRLGM